MAAPSRIQDVLFKALERAMREREWTCPRCRSAAHPETHAPDIALRCANVRCKHIHPISDRTLTQALRAANVRCPRCQSYVRPDRSHRRVLCSEFPVCRYQESWYSLLRRTVTAQRRTTVVYPPVGSRNRIPASTKTKSVSSMAKSPGLSLSVIANTAAHVTQNLLSDPVQHHHFQVRVAIQAEGPGWKTSVAIVPPDERGVGILVDVRGFLFFEGSDTYDTIRSRLRAWR